MFSVPVSKLRLSRWLLGTKPFPHFSVGVFNVSRKAARIHEGRRLHPGAQCRTKLAESAQVARLFNGDSNKILLRIADPVLHTKVAELTETGTSHHCSPQERDDWNSHPEGVKTGCVTIVRDVQPYALDIRYSGKYAEWGT